MKKIYALVLLTGLFFIGFAQTPVPMSGQPGGSFTENFSDISNWSNGFTSGIGANHFASVAVSGAGAIPSPTRISTASGTFSSGTSGGVQRGSSQTPALQSIVLLATGATDNTSSVAIDFLMDFTGVNAGTLSFTWASINNATGDRKGSLRVYYSTDGNSFSELSAAQVLNITNSSPTSGSITSVALPSAFNNSATARLRFYYYNGTGGTTGSRPKISIDDLSVTSTGGSSSVSVSAGSNASEPATPGNFTISFSTPTTSPTDLHYSFSGSATFGSDYAVLFSTEPVSSSSASGVITVPAGVSSLNVSITPNDDVTVEGTEGINLTLSAPGGGYTLGTSSASISLADNDVPPTLSVAAGANASEPSTNGSFNINLSAPAPPGGVTVGYSLSGTATPNTDYTDPLLGSITIAEGMSTGTVTLNTIDDTDPETTENISLTVNSATNGYVIGTASATINLLDNDIAPIALTGTYHQNFDQLATTGTANVMNIAGWAIEEGGNGARDNELYATDNGGSTTGDTYSYGTGGSTERALGSLRSGTLIPLFGAFFTNSTGTTITTLKISYTGEQWRMGTASRQDRLDFQYSLNATSLSSGVWSNADQLDFLSPNSGTIGAKDGNDPSNQTAISYTITGLSIAPGATLFIRWNDADASGADDGLAVDDLTVEANPLDRTAPVLLSLSPVNGATDVSANGTASINFDEAIQKGSGQIVIKRSDNTVFQTIDVASTSVSISGTSVSFPLVSLSPNTSFYVEMDAGAVKDLAGNDFAGIQGNSGWAFTTGTLFYYAGFQTCSSSLVDGFTQFSSVGEITWACTSFGRDPANAAGSAAFPYGVQINGFAGGTNVPNVDWLISPVLDLTGTDFPLLSFWSRTAFNGLPLQLKISTDYTGGDPSLATWTDVNGKFPAQTSNIWTQSSNINLAAFRQSNVHIAFVYTSTDEDGARWTLDDIRIDNSTTPPPPSLSTSTTDVQFNFVANGSSADKKFVVTGNDITGDLTLNASSGFLLSKDGTSFSSTLSYSVAEANNIPQTVVVRFTPNQPNQNFTGAISVSTSGLDATVNLKGSSIDPATTLEVVNWNIEWFGSTVNGPTNDDQQEQNIRTILQNVGADIYALAEVVSEERLARVVSQMPGYSYVISNFGSHTNTTDNPPGALAEAQKLAFVYKTSMFSNISTMPLLSQGINSSADLSNPAYNYWSSGRFPFMMSADVTLNCVTKNVKFVLVHAKANTSPTATSYDRRKRGADTLYQTLNQLYPDDKIMILGDFNDDLDQSVTAGFTTSSWNSFTTDPSRYTPVTLALSMAGKKSTVSYNDVIDHVVLSNEMQPFYMSGTANVLNDVSTLVSNYGSTTTDHYPVFTRYAFEKPAPPVVSSCPSVSAFCSTADGNYGIPAFAATNACGTISYSYTVTGATSRAGNSADASGHFNTGTSTIHWVAADAFGDSSTCETLVVVNENPVVTVNSPVKCSLDAPVTIQASTAGVGAYSYNWTVPGGVTDPGNVSSFNSMVAGTYSVVVTNTSSGCSAPANGILTVHDSPVVTVLSASKCATDAPVSISAVTDVPGTYDYVWSVPVGVVNPGNTSSFLASVDGIYSVIVTNAVTGCSGAGAGTLTVHPNPVVTIADAYALSSGVLPNTVYIGYAPASSLTLSSSASGGTIPYSYNWSNGSNMASVKLSPLTSTVYSLTVADANGCTATSAKSVSVQNITGKRPGKVIICHKEKNSLEVETSAVAEHLGHGDMLGACSDDNTTPGLLVSASPNPSASDFTLSLKGGNTEAKRSMRVVDVFGRTVEQKDNLTSSIFRIGQNYRPGIYFVMITEEGNNCVVVTLLKL